MIHPVTQWQLTKVPYTHTQVHRKLLVYSVGNYTNVQLNREVELISGFD